MEITMVKIFNVMKREDGENLIKRLKELTGTSFYNLEFILSPAGGSFDIYVQSDYEFTDEYDDLVEDSKKELHSIVNSLLISGIYLNR